MSSSGFQDDILQHQELIVTVLHSLLHAVFDFKPGNDLLREMVSDVPLHGSGKAHTGASAMDVDSGGHKGDR